MPGDQLAGGKPMAPCIGKVLDAGVLLQTAETAIHGVSRPWPAVGVEKYLARSAISQTAFENVGRPRVEPDDSATVLAFGLGRGKQNTEAVEMDVRGFHRAGLIGPASGFPAEFQKVAEGIGLGVVVADLLPLVKRNGLLAAFRGRFLDAAQRGLVEITDLHSPVECPLYGADGAMPEGWAPIGMGIDPVKDVKGLQCLGGQQRWLVEVVNEALDAEAIPLLRGRCLDPVR